MTDVHANLPALTAALAAIDRLGVDVTYHVGDAIAIGPYPRECLELLLARRDCRFIMGNHDEWFAFGLPATDAMSAGERAHQLWTHAQLDGRLREAVARWPYTAELEESRHVVGFIHYPRDANGHFLLPRRAPIHEAPIAGLFRQQPAFVFFGHDHQASDVVVGTTRLVNPGSLGCSQTPVARFVTLDLDQSAPADITTHAVQYDPDELLRAFAERDVPEREFIRRTFVLPDLAAST